MKNKALAKAVRNSHTHSLLFRPFYEFSYFVCGMEWSLPNVAHSTVPLGTNTGLQLPAATVGAVKKSCQYFHLALYM
jgi:hypothetical protein